VVVSAANCLAHFGSVGKVGKSWPAHKQNCGDIIVRFLPFLHGHMGGIIMKTITLAVTTMLLLAAITMTATPQSQTGNTAYEKKSYNYAEWAKGRFSEVVTVRNAGTIIYLGGVGAEDENSAQGGAIRHLGDFGAQCRYAWDKIKRLLEKHGATVDNIDKVVTYVTDIRYFFDAGKCRAEAYAGATQPAGTFLVVTALAWPGMLIEVDITAPLAPSSARLPSARMCADAKPVCRSSSPRQHRRASCVS
jgi:2-iminobutanoate/2-iminopropanoate deaminase